MELTIFIQVLEILLRDLTYGLVKISPIRATIPYCLLDLGLAPRLGEVVKLADPTVHNFYRDTSSARSKIVSIQFDFTGGSLVEVARSKIRPHNDNSQDAFHSFLGTVDEHISITGNLGVQENDQRDGSEIEGDSPEKKPWGSMRAIGSCA